MARSDDNDNVVPFPGTAAAVEEAAALWLARLNAGLDEAGHAKLRAWLHESPQHAQMLREMAAFWGERDLLEGLDVPAQPTRKPTHALRYAAAFVAAIGLGMAVYVFVPADDTATVAAVQYEQAFTTAIGERRTQNLPDGSVITLNTNTEVIVRYHERDRVVELQRGEAHFAVAHNPARPFGVRAAGHIVKAVGTAFTVRLQQAGSAEVTVTEGRVQILEAADTPATGMPVAIDDWWSRPALGDGLVPGQVAVVDGSAALPQINQLEPDALEIKLAWQEGMLVFESETLADVLAEFSRYTAVEFVLEDPQLGEQRIAGVIDAGDTDMLVGILQDNFGIDAVASNDRIVLRQRE